MIIGVNCGLLVILSKVTEKLDFKLYSPNAIYFAAIYAFWKTFKRCLINFSIEFELKCLLLGTTLLVTEAETNGARAMLEFLQNGRYWSIRFEVKYSSLLSQNRRIDLLLIEFVRLRESLPEYCISDSRARFDAIDHFLETRESLSSSTFRSIFQYL